MNSKKQVISLRKAGYSFREIARATGISKSRAQRIIKQPGIEKSKKVELNKTDTDKNDYTVLSHGFRYQGETHFPWLPLLILLGVIVFLIWIFVRYKTKN